MALATQCPHCHTTFRVAHDQLKLRAGLVRCGACKQIFNGIEYLLRQDEVTLPEASPLARTSAPMDATVPSTPAPVSPEQPVEESAPPINESGTTDYENGAIEQHAATDALEFFRTVVPSPPVQQTVDIQNDGEVDPLSRMTLMDLAVFQQDSSSSTKTETPSTAPLADSDAPDPLAKAIDDLQSKPLRGVKKSSRKSSVKEDVNDEIDYEEPSFVRQGNRRRRFGRALRIVIQAGSIILVMALFAQTTYLLRNQIASWFPDVKPLLSQGCALLGCQVGLPAQIEMVSIESSELQAVAQDKNIFTLTALLRNHSMTTQAWPNIELTLNDANETPVARKVFTPRGYLPESYDPAQGIEAKSERPVKLFLEISQLKASGYRVYLFYP